MQLMNDMLFETDKLISMQNLGVKKELSKKMLDSDFSCNGTRKMTIQPQIVRSCSEKNDIRSDENKQMLIDKAYEQSASRHIDRNFESSNK